MVQAALGRRRRRRSRGLVLDAKRGLDADSRLVLDGSCSAQAPAARRCSPSTRSTRSRPPARAAADRRRPTRPSRSPPRSSSRRSTGDGCEDLLDAVARAPARGALALPGGPALRPVEPRARGRDHARADLPPAAPGAALQHHRRDRGLGRERRTAARSGSTRRSTSCATARRRSCSARRGQQLKAIGEAARQELERMLEQARPPVPVRQGARELAGRPRALPRDGPGAGVSACAPALPTTSAALRQDVEALENGTGVVPYPGRERQRSEGVWPRTWSLQRPT